MVERKIHQIWLGNKKIPKHIKFWMEEIKEKHSNFEYYFWNDNNLPKLPSNLEKIYQNIPNPPNSPGKVDLIRMYLIYEYGGIYIDADFKYINGFNTFKINLDSVDGIIAVNGAYGMSALSNGFFAFKKNQELLKILLENINHSHQWLGPNYWSNILCSYFNYDSNVTFDDFQKDLNKYKIKLLNFHELETEYFRHNSLASWIPNSEWNKKLNAGNYD